MKTRVALIGITLFCCLGLTLSATAAPPLADRLPEKTLLYVGWAGTQSPTFVDSLFGQLVNDPALGKLITFWETFAQSEIPRKKLPAFKRAMSTLRIVKGCPMAMSWMDLEMTPQGPNPSSVFLIDLGDKRKAFEEHFNALLLLADKMPPFVDVTVGNSTYKSFTPPGGPEISYGYNGNIFFVTAGKDVAKQIIETTPDKSLQASKNFSTHMKAVSGDNEQISLYLDVSRFHERVSPMLISMLREEGMSSPRKLLSMFGLGKITAIAGSTRIVNREMYTKVRIFSPAPHRRLLIPFSGSALKGGDLSGIPADADLVAVVRVSPTALYREFRRLIKIFDRQADRKMSKDIAQMKSMLGVSLTKDILGNLGDRWVLAGASSQGGFLTGTFLSVEVKDAKALALALGKLERAFMASQAINVMSGRRRRRRQAYIESAKIGRTEIRYLVIPSSGFIPMPFAPAWAIHKDRFYFTLYPQVLESAIANHGKELLTKDASFNKLCAGINTNGASIFTYHNTPAIIRQVYNFILIGYTIGMNGVVRDDTRIAEGKPHLWLPSLMKLNKYLRPAVSSVRSDKTGITYEHRGSLPFVGLCTSPATPLLGSVAAIPALMQARAEAKRTMSAANLRSIGLSISMYTHDYRGKYPPNLAKLVEGHYISTNNLVSPASGRAAPKLIDGKLVGEIDYIYLGPIPDGKRTGRVIVAHERTEINRGKGVNVLFADGHVEWMTMHRFQRAMERSKKILSQPARTSKAKREAKRRAAAAKQRAAYEMMMKMKRRANEKKLQAIKAEEAAKRKAEANAKRKAEAERHTEILE